MAYACTSCEATFQSAAGVTQHVALHHNRCAECDAEFESADSLRSHIHEQH